jgi:hypothetical protein
VELTAISSLAGPMGFWVVDNPRRQGHWMGKGAAIVDDAKGRRTIMPSMVACTIAGAERA